MSRIGLRNARLERLAGLLGGHSHLKLTAVAEELGVSEMTIRRDVMDSGGRFACLGGHVIGAQNDVAGDYVLAKETDHHAAAKEKACAKAARLIEDDDTIFIDCGTTTPHLAALIPPDLRLTAICYSLNVAEILSRRQNTRLILLGGLFHPAAASFSGEAALDQLKRISLNKAFISAGGVHETRGVTCSHFHEVPVKQAAIARAVVSYLVVDASKFGKVRAAHFAEIAAFTSVVSDRD
ncbi:DeoR/GlpR family DNA-binding transcription regulator [Mesorhizobium sp. KR9-304]|uniref:DeoR/GlpR family DNA-binding transcription regulator n=1 Tax=Mesorhizobium sp. KR9-304 TaxID=3156614 RepID=UPI0032B52C33